MRLILIILILISLKSVAQDPLDAYIHQGLESNLALKQIQADYEKNRYVLKEARGLFFPSLSLSARYTVAHGGRTIDIPAGDMMNGVYYTLNQITTKMNAAGLSDEVFPDTTLENETIQFLRSREQETKLQLIQPIFNPQIFYNYKISQMLVETGKTSADLYKRSLVCEIKKAYYSYIQTVGILLVLEKTDDLID